MQGAAAIQATNIKKFFYENDSTVSIVTRQLGWTIPRSIPSQEKKKKNSLPSKMSRPAMEPTRWVLFSLVVGRQGSETHYSPPTRAKVKNEWNCISTPPVCLHGVYQDVAFYVY